jgi:integrase
VASIRKRKRAKGDVWIVDLRDRGGPRLTVKSKEAAELLRAEKVRELADASALIGDPKLTFGEYRRQWLRQITAEGVLSPSSIAIYAHQCEKHLFELDARRLRELHKPEINHLLKRKREAGLKKATVRLIRAALTRMLGDAVDDGLIAANVALGGSRRRKSTASEVAEREKAIRPFDQVQVDKLLETARQREADLYPFLMLMHRAGLRPGEAGALKWEDLDFDTRTITVERALARDGRIGPTKTGAIRKVDMSQGLRAALTSLYVEREKQALQYGWGEVPVWVFVDREAKLLTNENVRKRCARLLRLAKISGHRIYDLRHTFISTLLANGEPITYVSEQAGHASANTTLAFYAHWMPKGDRAAVDRLDVSGHGTNLAPITVKSQEEGQNPTTVDCGHPALLRASRASNRME